jgi:hypothetical protein
VYAEDVYRHVSDTAYLEKHAREALRILENAASTAAERLEVAPLKRDGKKRQGRTFPPEVLVRFSG